MNSATARIRIAVANSQEIYREALGALLSGEAGFHVVARGHYRSDLAEELRRTEPDILLLDRDHADTMWLSRLRATAGLENAPKAILLADSAPEERILEGIEIGLRGVVAPDSPKETLFKCIRCVSAGEYWIGRERVANLMDYLRRKKSSASPTTEDQLGLTSREKDVIGALLTGASNKEIAQSLSISSQAVRHHLSSIFEKLGVANRLELALFAMQHGICCRPGAMAQAAGKVSE